MNQRISPGQIAKSNPSFNQHEMVGQVIQTNGCLKASLVVVAAGTPGTSCIRGRQHNEPMVLRISEKKIPFLELGIFTQASDVLPSPLHPSTVLH